MFYAILNYTVKPLVHRPLLDHPDFSKWPSSSTPPDQCQGFIQVSMSSPGNSIIVDTYLILGYNKTTNGLSSQARQAL